MIAIAMVIILTVGIVEIFGFTAAIYIMNKKLEELRLEREKYNTGIFQTLSTFLDGLKKRNDKQNQLIHEIKEQSKILKEQYEALDESYDYMNERYKEICEHYSNLLKCWSGVEERYSDCYEQLKYQNERFDKIEKFINEWNQNVWHPEEDIDMDISPLVGGETCDSEDCHLSRTEREIKEFEGTTCDFNKEGICKNKNCRAGDTPCPHTNPMKCSCSEVTIPYSNNIDISKSKHQACEFEKEGICRHPEFISPMVGQECPFLNPETCRYSCLL